MLRGNTMRRGLATASATALPRMRSCRSDIPLLQAVVLTIRINVELWLNHLLLIYKLSGT